MEGDTEEHRPSTDPHALVDQAARIVAEQAGITLAGASTRISLYARFRDLQIVDVSHGIIDGTITLLHYGERRRRPTDPSE